MKKSIPPKSLFYINDVLYSYYKKLRNIQEKKVAYVSFGFPKHFLYAMDIVPVYPQFHAGLQSARGKAGKILRKVEADLEFPHDICGEVKNSVGTVLYGEQLSFKLPDPQLVVSSSNLCIQASKGFQFLGRKLDIPYYFCDLPCVAGDDYDSVIDYSKKQAIQICQQIEDQFQVKMDLDKLREYVRKDLMAFEVWNEIMKLMRYKPVPVDAMDLYLCFMLFHTVDPATDDLLNIMIGLYNDLYAAAQKNTNESSQREYRLLWDLLPVYHKKDFFSDTLGKYNASVAMSTYFFPSSYYIEDVEPIFDYPLTLSQVENHFGRPSDDELIDLMFIYQKADSKLPLDFKKKKMEALISDFEIDGVIMHMDRSCRTICLTQYQLMQYIQMELNKPVFIFDADSMDEHYFFSSQIATRLEAFMENI